MTIPIRNIYYLLLYAWDALEEKDEILVSGLPDTQLADLFGRVLHSAISRLFRRGIDRSYAGFTETLNGVRGRIELTPTLTGELIQRGRAVCSFDELTTDSPLNRILRATAERIARVPTLEPRIASLMRECVAMLRDARSIPLTLSLCRQTQLHQNNKEYRLPLAIAELLATNSLVDERDGAVWFRDFSRDEGPLALLFQNFVLNFLKREQSVFRVTRRALSWRELAGPIDAVALLPKMYTDVSLERGGHTVVIETKYYKDPFVERHDRRRARSGHLYQLYAYIRNTGGAGERVDGILLYAQAGEPEDAEVRLQGHRLRLLTLDLSASWEQLHEQLVGLVSWGAAA